MKPFVVYSLARFGILGGVAVLLWFLGLDGFLAVAVAVVLSVPMSYLLLARQRAALSGEVERRLDQRRTQREDLRARLRGDDTTDSTEVADTADTADAAGAATDRDDTSTDETNTAAGQTGARG